MSALNDQQAKCYACAFTPASVDCRKAKAGECACLPVPEVQGEDESGLVLGPLPFSEIVGRWCKQIQDKKGK